MSNHWLRWHIGTCEDGKFRMIARNAKVTVGNAIALWSLLLEDASHPEHRGICTRGEDFYGAILDLSFDEIAVILSAMEQVEMISVGHGNITISNWNKRQFETDAKDPTNTERQRRYKERRKQNDNKTNGNASVTVKKHQIQNTDTDTKKKESKRRGTRFALTAAPDVWVDYCKAKRPDLDPQGVFEDFRDYWIAEPDGVKLDWTATWKKWVRNQKGKPHANTSRNTASGAKPTWKSEGERLAAKYAAEAEREEQAAANTTAEPNLRLAEAVRQDPG